MCASPASDHDLTFAVELARQAGRVTLEWFGRPDLVVDRKSDGSPVTAADRAAERLMRTEITRRFPDDAVVGEEEPDAAGRSPRTWVIDPIDGTKAFAQGVPLFSTLVALVDGYGPAVGVIHLPGLGETVWAGRGRGAYHDGVRCGVSSCSELAESYVCTSGFSYWPRHQLDRVLDRGVKLRTWGDAYGYALVATGRAEAMVDPECSTWDVAPMAVILGEAGGRFTDARGARSWTSGSGVATNGLIHDEVLSWLRD